MLGELAEFSKKLYLSLVYILLLYESIGVMLGLTGSGRVEGDIRISNGKGLFIKDKIDRGK